MRTSVSPVRDRPQSPVVGGGLGISAAAGARLGSASSAPCCRRALCCRSGSAAPGPDRRRGQRTRSMRVLPRVLLDPLEVEEPATPRRTTQQLDVDSWLDAWPVDRANPCRVRSRLEGEADRRSTRVPPGRPAREATRLRARGATTTPPGGTSAGPPQHVDRRAAATSPSRSPRRSRDRRSSDRLLLSTPLCSARGATRARMARTSRPRRTIRMRQGCWTAGTLGGGAHEHSIAAYAKDRPPCTRHDDRSDTPHGAELRVSGPVDRLALRVSSSSSPWRPAQACP